MQDERPLHSREHGALAGQVTLMLPQVLLLLQTTLHAPVSAQRRSRLPQDERPLHST